MTYTDAHIHLYPPKLMEAIFRYFDRANFHFPYRANAPEALDYLRKSGMARGFLLLYAHKRNMSLSLNSWASELCRSNQDLVPFGCFHPEDEKPHDLVRTCLEEWGFAGFKLHFHVQQFMPEDPRFDPVYSAVQEMGRAVVMHISSFPRPTPYLGAERLRAVLERFPRLKVLVAHLGFTDIEDFWQIMDKYPSVYLDTAFVLGNPIMPQAHKMVLASLERFPDRVLYGSDFPLIFHDINDGLASIEKLPWDLKVKERLLSINADKFLLP